MPPNIEIRHNNAQITVAVIIPVYNVKQYLSQCVESVLEQTYSNIIVVLIDDGSTDGSDAICDEFERRDPRVETIHKENGGVCSARNCGLQHIGDAKYVVLVDSDDVIHPQLIENTVWLANRYDLDSVIFGYKTFNDGDFKTTFLQPYSTINERIELLSREKVLREILSGKRFRMLACNKLYKTDLWDDIFFPTGRKYGDDTSVTYRLMDKITRVGYIQDSYYYYRMRNGSALHSKISHSNLELFNSYSEMVDYFEIKDPTLMNEVYSAYCNRLFDFFAKLFQSDINREQRFDLLTSASEIARHYSKQLCNTKGLTRTQLLLLKSFFTSIKLFYCVYSTKCFACG